MPILQTMGGSLIVRTGRQPTDMVGEAVTTHAVCEWIPHVHASASIEDRVEEGSEQPVGIDVIPDVLEDEALEAEPVEA